MRYSNPGYRERSYDPPCPGHWTPEAPDLRTACPEPPRASDCDEAGVSGGSEAVSGTLEELDPEVEAEVSEGAEPELEPQMDPEPEPAPELVSEPEPEPEPDFEAGDESEGVRLPKPGVGLAGGSPPPPPTQLLFSPHHF